MGAHQSSPSGVERGGLATTLDAVIAADPIGELGQECVDRFGPRLPFLLKILAAEKALSIQVHPDRSQAEAGFQAENDRGMSQGDPARNYVDDWPKPEVLCALTPFEALAGFRDPREAADLLETLEIEDLNPLAVALRASKNPSSLTGALGRLPPLISNSSEAIWSSPMPSRTLKSMTTSPGPATVTSTSTIPKAT